MTARARNNYLKVVKQGGTRTLAVGRVIPPDWRVVKVEVEGIYRANGKEWIQLFIEKVA